MCRLISFILLLTICNAFTKVHGQNLYQTRTAEFQPHVSGHVTAFNIPENPPLGSNYLKESWVAGTIQLFHGQVIKGYLFKFDISQNQLEIQYKSIVKVLDGSQIEHFTVYDKESDIEKYFINPFLFNPAIGRKNGFYEVIEPGDKLSLLAGYEIEVIKGNYDPKFDIGDKQEKIIQKRNLFFLKGEELLKVKNKLKRNKEVFKNGYESVEAFMKKEDLGYDSESDLKKLVRYYNEN